jgi:dipeptidyl aminopeptidase/acylaminoacyl peptidase
VPIILGKPVAESGEEIKFYSPITHVAKGAPPTFLLHGTADKSVPLAQSQHLEARLKEVGTTVTTVYLEGEGHMPAWDKPAWRDALAKGIAFMKANL